MASRFSACSTDVDEEIPHAEIELEQADDTTRCTSKRSDIRLNVTVTVEDPDKDDPIVH